MNLRTPGIKKKEVMFMNPEDMRFEDIPVDKETEKIVYCKKWHGILYRFFKLGPGWTGKVIRFLGVEGYPLVSYVSGQDDDGEDLWATVTIEEFLKLIWTEKGYNGLPAPLKELVINPPIGTIVSIKPLIPDKDMQKKFDELKAEGILYDADLANLANLGTAKEVKKFTDKVMDRVPWVLAGMGLTYVLMGFKILRGF